VLWLAEPELRAATARLLDGAGVSLRLPARFEDPFAALPDLVLLGEEGGGPGALAEIAQAKPGLADVPVLPLPGRLELLDAPAREAFARLLANAIGALVVTRPASERSFRRRYEGEAAARLRSEIGELRMTRLLEVSAALSRQATRSEVASVVLTQGVQALCADTGYVALRQGDVLDVVFLPGFPEEVAEQLRRIPMTAELPVVDCVVARRPRIYASRQEVGAQHPDLPNAAPFKTRVYLPLTVDDHAVGAIGLFYAEETSFAEFDRRYMDLLARQCALALERARMHELERDARRAREEALAIAAHDLRTPLSSISLAAALLEQSADEKVRDRGRVIHTAAERAVELLRDLLDAAVIEQGRLRVDVAACDGAALLGELCELFAPLAESRRITLRIGCSGDVGAIAVDRARMHQALSNLLGNALKFTPEGGTVEVRLTAGDGPLRFVVRDTGPGLDPENVPRIFDRYWQTRATNRAGAGLGLYIVKGIVEAHGGTVRVDTAPGAGTTFTLSIGGAW
jgi:signal transduction histidine kinase